jgi:alkanesulfonate monooxygenase SsuD/methylene tetrahydromethanopterin reductase-like flavin-dependent oxidoreductase (luciferase family)
MVTDVTLRHPAHLAKVIASLDVLSGGRAICGLGLGWWEHEHRILGIPFPPVAERYALLQDALELLPVMWGPGSPAYAGRMVEVSEATCYPRPLQEHVPVLVGGSGEKRTLRIAARLADACNLFGDPPTVARRVGVVRDHLASAGRDPSQFQITHLSTAVVARTPRELAVSLDRVRGSLGTPEAATSQFGAGTVADQIGRYRQLAEAGVQTAIVALPDVAGPGTLESFGEVIAAFGGGSARW